MNRITLILPYYCQPNMLAKQMEIVAEYPEEIDVIVVDDGSPEPAQVPEGISLYRIEEDIPWNREQARNIGAYVAATDWIIQTDIDHVLPVESAKALISHDLNESLWYRFPRWRVGRADETRKKDSIHHMKKFGKIHPHIDSYLMTRWQFMASPYDERFSGSLGGGTPFLERQKSLYGEPHTLPDEICLHVYTSHEVKDSSIDGLSRDKSEYIRKREEFGHEGAKTILHHPWHQVQ